MSRHKQIYALAFAVMLTGALPACAAYRKCGFAGCPGDAKITAEVRALIAHYPAAPQPAPVTLPGCRVIIPSAMTLRHLTARLVLFGIFSAIAGGAAAAPLWMDTPVARLEALTLIQTLNVEIRSEE